MSTGCSGERELAASVWPLKGSSSSDPGFVDLSALLIRTPDLFDLLDLHDLPLVLQPSALVGLRRRYNFEPLNWCSIQGSSPGEDFRCARKAVIYQYPFGKPTPTNTLCKADINQYSFCKANTYQHPLRSRHLDTSTLCEAANYQYPMVRDDAQHSTRCRLPAWYEVSPSSIVRGAVLHSTMCRPPT